MDDDQPAGLVVLAPRHLAMWRRGSSGCCARLRYYQIAGARPTCASTRRADPRGPGERARPQRFRGTRTTPMSGVRRQRVLDLAHDVLRTLGVGATRVTRLAGPLAAVVGDELLRIRRRQQT